MKAYHILGNIILCCIFAAASTSCEKTLDVDYDDISPLLVVEGNVSNEGVRVYLKETRDMTDSITQNWVTDATVSISGSDGYNETLVFGESFYYSPSNYTGVPGVTYTLNVTHKDRHCTAKSTMPQATDIDSVWFKWVHFIGDVYIRTCYIHFQDDPTTSDYYMVTIRKNTELYHDILTQDVFDDRQMDETYNFIHKGIMSKNDWEDAMSQPDVIQSDIIYPGDAGYVELRSIDIDAFKYLNSGEKNQSQAVNPKTNLVGNDCIGYFSAFYTSKSHFIYENDDY